MVPIRAPLALVICGYWLLRKTICVAHKLRLHQKGTNRQGERQRENQGSKRMKQSNRGELGRRDDERPRGRRDDEQPGGGREGPRREKPGQEKAGLIPLKARYLKAQGASLQAPRGSTMEPVALGFRPTGTR